MLLKSRTRANSRFAQGPGGRHCVCCDDPPKYNKKNRRHMRRIEKREWKAEK